MNLEPEIAYTSDTVILQFVILLNRQQVASNVNKSMTTLNVEP
jgi:hypothetical protein